VSSYTRGDIGRSRRQGTTGSDLEPVERTPTLNEIGIDKKLSSQAQKLASIFGTRGGAALEPTGRRLGSYRRMLRRSSSGRNVASCEMVIHLKNTSGLASGGMPYQGTTRLPTRATIRGRSRVARPPVDHEHGGLHGPGAEPVQGFLAGLMQGRCDSPHAPWAEMAPTCGGMLAASISAFAYGLICPSRAADVFPVTPPPGTFSWTGPYVGVNVGGGVADVSTTATAFGGSLTASETHTGIIGGGQIGFNWQTGPAVLGAEISAPFADGWVSHLIGGFPISPPAGAMAVGQ
jgi:hypothetical protein